MSDDKKWIGGEKIPYDKCPRCGKYKFRKLKVHKAKKKEGGGILKSFSHIDYESEPTIIKKCSNCKYREEVDTDES